MFVYWNSGNIDHIAKHRVTQDEAEYVLRHAAPPYPQSIGDGKYLVQGKTSVGRFLQVIFVYRPLELVDLGDVPMHRRLELQDVNEVIFIIHARELENAEKRRLRARRGRQ
jgi:hypothetical protein